MNERYDRDSGIFRGVRPPDPNEMLSMISHDMRAPLMAVLGAVDLLEGRDTGLLNEHQRHLVELIRRSGQRLRGLASELSELGAAGRGRLELSMSEESLATLLKMVVEEMWVLADARRMRVELGALPDSRALVDAHRLWRAFHNVIGNAVKHARSEVRVWIEQPDSETSVVVVEDDGPGLPEDILPIVFEPFVRVGGAGMGLGLAIVREVVRAHGGRVTASNRKDGRGARFELIFPNLPVPQLLNVP